MENERGERVSERERERERARELELDKYKYKSYFVERLCNTIIFDK